MNELPLVSVGLPVYNMKGTVGRALDSLLAQDYPNLEIIVSDNCSTDGTTRICRQYTQEHPGIMLNVNKSNMGVIYNTSLVFDKAKGKYFFFAGGDDYWHPEFTSTLVKELENDKGAVLALPAMDREYDDGEKEETKRFLGKSDPEFMSSYSLIMRIISTKKEIRKQKYNLFVMGLYRKKILDKLWNSFPAEVLGERPLVAAMALQGRLIYVDRVLMTKTLHRKQFKERHPDDTHLKKIKGMSQWERYLRIFYYMLKASFVMTPKQAVIFSKLVMTVTAQLSIASARGRAGATLRALGLR